MTAALYTLFVVNSFFLIFVVLLQSGRGVGLGEFGGSTGSAVFGSAGASTLLQKLTAWSAATFMVLSLVLALRSASSSVTTEGEFVTETEAPAIVGDTAPPAVESNDIMIPAEIPAEQSPVEAPADAQEPTGDAPAADPEAPVEP